MRSSEGDDHNTDEQERNCMPVRTAVLVQQAGWTVVRSFCLSDFARSSGTIHSPSIALIRPNLFGTFHCDVGDSQHTPRRLWSGRRQARFRSKVFPTASEDVSRQRDSRSPGIVCRRFPGTLRPDSESQPPVARHSSGLGIVPPALTRFAGGLV